MNVLVFTSLFPNNVWPDHGVFVKERIAHLAKRGGCAVKVIAPVPYFPPFKLGWRWKYSLVKAHEIREGFDVYHPRYFITPKLGMVFYGFMMCLSVLPLVRRIRRNFDFDLIDAHFVYPDGFAAIVLGRLFRRPVVVSARGSDISLFGRRPVIRMLVRYALSKAERVVAVSEALKEAIVELGIPEGKISVIPNGVNSGRFYRVPKEEARRKLGLPPDRKVVVSVGRLVPGKGFDLLIKAFRALVKTINDKSPYLVIIGEGRSQRQLERLVSSLNLNEHVHLAGAVSHEELYLWYGAADLSCLASSREGWPNVLLESLACGTPVVATDVGGAPEIIRSDEIGLLTQRDERKIGEAIDIGLNKHWRSDEIIAYAREHTWEQTALAVLRVFESIFKGKSGFCPMDRPASTIGTHIGL